jgi:putative ABC transport system permease protein
MGAIGEMWRRLKMLGRREEFARELDEEMRSHREMRERELAERGVEPDEARYAAARAFGNAAALGEQGREAWGWRWLEDFLQDLRFGARMLRKNPGFTLTAVLTLALGIGANSYIFSMVDALLLRPLAFPQPERLVALWERVPSEGIDRSETSPANYLDWEKQNHAFDHLAAFVWWDVNVGGIERPDHVRGFQVTPDFFAALEVQPMLGRGFLEEEGHPGKDQVAVLSYTIWRERFGSDPAVIGKRVLLNGVSCTIVGVMGPEFNYPAGSRIWAPLTFGPELAANRGAHYLRGVAHLRPGTSVAQAQAEMSAIAASLAKEFPQSDLGRDVHVQSLLDSEVGMAQKPLMVVVVAVGLVLLIACGNISNLLLARSDRRKRETAIRTALGATRLRLVRQSLVESVLLGLLGGGTGILLAVWCLHAKLIAVPAEFVELVPGLNHLRMNLPVLLVTLGISVGTGLVFGFLPALRGSRPDVNEALKEGGAGSGAGRSRTFLRSSLIVAEVALSLTLLTCAGLLMKSFVHLLNVSPGFNPNRVLTMFVALPQVKYPEDERAVNFFEQLVRRVEALPGVQSVATVNMLPLGGANMTRTIRIEGQPEPAPGHEPEASFRSISTGYFRTMQIPLPEGREFTEQDSATHHAVAVNQAFVETYWPGKDALGKHMRFSGPVESNPWYEVVAVIGNVRNQLPEPARPEMYFPMREQVQRTMALVIRTSVLPTSLAESARAEVQKLDPDQPVFDVMTMEDWRSVSVIAQQVAGTLMAAFAALALLLALVGLYGVIAYMVVERRREISIRMALGARPREIFAIVIGEGGRLALIGIAVGLAASLGLAKAIGGLLFGVSATDAGTFVGVSAILLGTALGACYIPARRAMRVDPMVALRHE